MTTVGIAFILAILLLLAVGTGLSIGLTALGRGHRGAAWRIMAIGSTLLLASPVLHFTGLWKEKVHHQRIATAFRSNLPPPPPMNFEIFSVGASLMCLCGLMGFAAGFVLHGRDCARKSGRSAKLENLLAGMDAEISRLEEGKEASGTTTPTLPPESAAGTAPDRSSKVILLLAIVAVLACLWTGSAALSSSSLRERETMERWIIFIVLAASAFGMQTGLASLRNASEGGPNSDGSRKRGDGAWRLMAIGTFAAFVLVLAASVMEIVGSYGSVHALASGLSFLLAPCGIILFAGGFALHGLKTARQRERVAELEKLSAAMEEEIARLKNA